MALLSVIRRWALGYTGSYGRVAAFARKWQADREREEQSAGRGTELCSNLVDEG